MSRLSQLSAREEAVKELVLMGKTNKQIAHDLGISTQTVEFHLKNIYAKSHVSSRVEFILKLRDTAGGLIPEKLGIPQLIFRREKPKMNAGQKHV